MGTHSSIPHDTVSTHGLGAKKALGQHFLLDMNITRKIVRLAGNLSGINVIEIGPGPGGLTKALLESNAASITAIEKDRRFVETLQPLALESEGRLKIIEADALEINLRDSVPAPRAIIANLPYNVGTLLFTNWLHEAMAFEHFTLMFQKEVVERITASVNSKAYGRLSILTQLFGHAKTVMQVPASCFVPPPKVDSSVMHFTPHPHNLFHETDISIEAIEKITAQAFSQRRKMLRAIFKGSLSESDFKALGLKPDARPENLSPAEFIKLAKAVSAPKNK